MVAADGVAIRQVARSERQFPLVLPIHCPFGGLQGHLLVGPRPDGSSYGKDEVEVLKQVLPALRRALLVSLEQEKARRRKRKFQRNVERRIVALEAAITR